MKKVFLFIALISFSFSSFGQTYVQLTPEEKKVREANTDIKKVNVFADFFATELAKEIKRDTSLIIKSYPDRYDVVDRDIRFFAQYNKKGEILKAESLRSTMFILYFPALESGKENIDFTPCVKCRISKDAAIERTIFFNEILRNKLTTTN